MSSLDSASKPINASAFSELHPSIQRWVYGQGWRSLHEAQERAIPVILSGQDAIISAPTAAGKTEAAFLPILSRLITQGTPSTTGGVQVLYVSPLKALINDQYDRLLPLAECAGVPVHRWHGDVAGGAKVKVLHGAPGILIITPESIEAMFVNHGNDIPTIFGGLRYVVIDEIHAFIGSPRGAQVQSLLHRIDLARRATTPRIGLSATLRSLEIPAEFLRPGAGDDVVKIDAGHRLSSLDLQLRGYTDSAELNTNVATATDETRAVANHIFAVTYGSNNLVFANSRSAVEELSALLKDICDERALPRSYFAHHGNLSKAEREDVEGFLKRTSDPVTAVCTSTLELGIDIGAIHSVAQIGAPPSVAALRQRVGRSGRRDAVPILRGYVVEAAPDPLLRVLESLRVETVQTITMTELMLEGWVEDPTDWGLNLSTLIQQVLSVIAQRGSATVSDLHRALCGPGPFSLVTPADFAVLMHDMARKDLIVQSKNLALLHGAVGERIVNHYSFYAAFAASSDWQVIAGPRKLGTAPKPPGLQSGDVFVFAGQRWIIDNIDSERKAILVSHAAGGAPPHFRPTGIPPMDPRVASRMLDSYNSASTPPWIDAEMEELLYQGRTSFRQYGLGASSFLENGSDLYVFPWCGTKGLYTASMLLKSRGVRIERDRVALVAQKITSAEVADIATSLLDEWDQDAERLAATIEDPMVDKWDEFLCKELLAKTNATRLLDAAAGLYTLGVIAGRTGTTDPPASS